ncbi:MAG: 3-hydroxyacyl-CoA dehydrogenase NAD-binding domain-containing protein [Thermodesulfobacteriota bacterium]|nr:3-hydroxyacyl-CoA dehydrogenase NAD-binding domain-containing protein [Thermodesulfobacteriota bacterium]
MEMKRVCVVGMGTMGSQIGIVCARAGFQTFMVDILEEQVGKGLQSIESFLKTQEKKGKVDREAIDRISSFIKTGIDMGEALSDADLVIEAVYEDIKVKKEVFKKMDEVSPSRTIFASNTSTLWIAELGAVTDRPEKCIGTHFLIPAALTPLVEVVRSIETSDETHETVLEFLRKCGKETVTVADSPGFVINRLYLPMVNEAFFALETGLASAEEIDRSCTRGLAFPLGPLAAADAFGLDILLASMETFHRELGEKYRPAPLLVKLVKAGRLGRKTGRGVYNYSKPH